MGHGAIRQRNKCSSITFKRLAPIFCVSKSLFAPFIILPFVYSVHQWVGIMGKSKSMVDTFERLVEFWGVYEIPENVRLSYCPEFEVEFSRGEGKGIIPLVTFVKGGGGVVRIPLNKLLTDCLRNFKVCPDQYTPNIFRVVNSVVELNRRLDLSLAEHEINHVYSF